MEQQYYIRLRGRVQGPFSVTQLQKLGRRGKFGRHYHVSLNGREWMPAASVPELVVPPPPPKSLTRHQTNTDANTDADADMLQLSDDESPVVETEPNDQQTGAQTQEGGETEWFYTHNGQEHGPVWFDQLKLVASTGQLRYDDFLWSDGMPDWVPAAEVPGVFSDEGQAGMPRAITYDSQYPQGPGSVPTAPMAVASFVSALLGASIIIFLASIPAIVFGHIALRQINQSGNALGGRGMAIAGLILGYIVVITAVVVGLAVLAVLAMRETSVSSTGLFVLIDGFTS